MGDNVNVNASVAFCWGCSNDRWRKRSACGIGIAGCRGPSVDDRESFVEDEGCGADRIRVQRYCEGSDDMT